jgi:hypothetical protein
VRVLIGPHSLPPEVRPSRDLFRNDMYSQPFQADKRLPADGDFFALELTSSKMRSNNQGFRPVAAVDAFDRADDIADA